MTVAELMDTMSSFEMTEWVAYFEVLAHESARDSRRQEMGFGGGQVMRGPGFDDGGWPI